MVKKTFNNAHPKTLLHISQVTKSCFLISSHLSFCFHIPGMSKGYQFLMSTLPRYFLFQLTTADSDNLYVS